MAADSTKEKFSNSCKEKGKAVSRHKYCSLSPLSSHHYSPLLSTCLGHQTSFSVSYNFSHKAYSFEWTISQIKEIRYTGFS